MEFTPIGYFRCAETHSYDAARQGTVARDNAGRVVLEEGHNFEQALQDVAGFSHVWLIFQFHHNTAWKPLVQPPRGNRKVGVFASRAPYRPNPIGMSCVRLLSVSGRTLHVADHDLLDGTPILDIKPYIPYADCIPDATSGWLADLEDTVWVVGFSEAAREQLEWLEARGVTCLEAFLRQQLGTEPFNRKRKRLKRLGEVEWEIAYRTWRAHFTADEENLAIHIDGIRSAYTETELVAGEDPYGDMAVHRLFLKAYS
jgi:tRNA-Thr(GGU) m(6)t(6)A37 methyltransferase TsaA